MATEEFLMYGLGLAAAAIVGVLVYPAVSQVWLRLAGKVERVQQVRVEKATRALDDIFVDVKPTWLRVAYGLGPVGTGLLAWIVLNSWILAAVGAVLGWLLPDVWVKQTRLMRTRRFRAQLVDVLFTLSSSLRAGLSLGQAFEIVEAEIGPPASQEFGLVVKAHRMGQTLEQALQRLNQRIPCDELQLITTAILVARETGGDITNIITQLVGTIREKKKLGDKVQTLTLQGRLQAYIMSVLPVAFAFVVRSFNPRYFDVMLKDSTGVVALAVAGGLWVVGMVLLMRFSRVEI